MKKINPYKIFTALKMFYASWTKYKLGLHGAAISFFTISSLPSLLSLIIIISSIFYDWKKASNYLVSLIGNVAGKNVAGFVDTIINNSFSSETFVTATIVNAITLLILASAVFIQLREALNTIFDVVRKKTNKKRTNKGIIAFIYSILNSFVHSVLKPRIPPLFIILGLGLILPILLVSSVVLTTISDYISNQFLVSIGIWNLIEFFVSLIILTIIFAFLFKFIPDVILRWKDVWVGGVVTSVFVLIGKFIIDFILIKSTTVSIFGASGSLFLFMLWTFYASQIVLFGALFTRFYVLNSGASITPDEDAVKL